MSILAIRQNIGICLVFVGVTTSMYLNYFFRGIYWTPLIMLASCILLCDAQILSAKPRFNKSFKAIVAFQLLMLVYYFVSFRSGAGLWTKQLIFHLYILILTFILMRTPALRERNFMPWLLFYSGILSIVAAIFHFTGIIQLERMLNGDDAVLEVFTCNVAAFINFVVCLLTFDKKRKYMSLVYIALIIVDMYVIMMSAKRSYFVSVFSVTAIYLYKTRNLLKGLFVGLIVLLVMSVVIPQVREMAMDLFDRTIDGFSQVYIEKKSNVVDFDDSASIRAEAQRIALKKFQEFGPVELILGGGYLFCFFDNPLGESYLDMGIPGLLFYTYLIVIMPIAFLRKLRSIHKKQLFCFCVAFMNITIILVNNDPYIYLAYTPLCMMAMYSYKEDFNNYKNIR